MRLLIDIGQQLAVKLAIKWPFERFELTDDRAGKNVIGYREPNVMLTLSHVATFSWPHLHPSMRSLPSIEPRELL